MGPTHPKLYSVSRDESKTIRCFPELGFPYIGDPQKRLGWLVMKKKMTGKLQDTLWYLPSLWKITIFMGKSTINGHVQKLSNCHYKKVKWVMTRATPIKMDTSNSATACRFPTISLNSQLQAAKLMTREQQENHHSLA